MVQTFSLYALVGVDWQSTRWHEVPLAPPLGELLSGREAEGVYPVEWKMLPISSRHCRGRYKTGGAYSLTYDTPSVSPFGLTAECRQTPVLHQAKLGFVLKKGKTSDIIQEKRSWYLSLHTHFAYFFRFMAANLSFTQFVT